VSLSRNYRWKREADAMHMKTYKPEKTNASSAMKKVLVISGQQPVIWIPFGQQMIIVNLMITRALAGLFVNNQEVINEIYQW